MDKKDSLENLSYLKDILNIKQYDDVIKNFNSSKFENFIERKDKNTNKIEISNATTNKIDDQKYTGNEVLPNLEIYYNGELLKNDIDYDVVYLNNEQVGTAKVLVVGLDRFYGILETEFQIVK